MKKQTLHQLGRAGCVSLAAVLALSAPNAALASASSAQKDETVYVSLDSAGAVQSTIVSDWLHSDDTSRQIADRSDLQNIQNVKTDEKAIRRGDTLQWVLDADNGSKNIYYQGTTDKKAPLSVSLAYTLDGKPVTAEEIAGKSGKVTISLTVRNTDTYTVSVRGKNIAMNAPMTVIAAAILPSDTFRNVKINSGKLLSDGNNQFVTFSAMPGLSESLGLADSGFSELSGLDFPDTLTIEADAEKFHLPSVTIAAAPKLIDSDKLAQTGDIGELVSSLDQLKQIQTNLENADPQKNLRSLFTDPDRTAAARLLIDDVFDFYGLDTRAADILPKYVNDGTFRLCDRITSDLSKADLKYLLDSNILSKTGDSLAAVDTKKAEALLNDYEQLSTFDTSKLAGLQKLMNDYGKASGSLNSVLQDTGSLLNATSADSLSVLAALGSPGVRSGLSGTLSSMNGLSAAASAAGLESSASLQFSQADIQALLQSYLSRNLAGLMGQTIDGKAANGKISAGALLTLMNGFGMSLSALPADQQQALAASFLSNNPGAAVSASALGGITPDAAVTPAVLQQLQAMLAQPGVVDSNGKVKLQTLTAAVSGVPNGQAVLTDLMSQMMPTVLQENPDAALPASDVKNALGAALQGMSPAQQQAFVTNLAAPAAAALTPYVNSLLSSSAGLQSSLRSELGSDYAGRLAGAMASLGSCGPYLDNLQKDLGTLTWSHQTDLNSCLQEAEALLSDKEDLDYLASWAGKLSGMEADLKSNSGNIAVLKSLMNTADSAQLKTFAGMLPTLRSDLRQAYPLAASLRNDLSRPEVQASLQSLPQTAKTLLKIGRDVMDNRDLMEIMKQGTEPGTVSLFRGALDTLDGLQKDGTADLYLQKLDSAEDLLARKDAYLKLADQHSIFSESAEGTSTTLKFVYKTAEIKVPEEKPAPVRTASSQAQSGGGFFHWLRSLFSWVKV